MTDDDIGNIAEARHDSSAKPLSQPAPEIPFDLFCQQCGYNLRALTSDRCPECGYSLDSVRSEVSGIPWVHRKSLGRFRAYWKTVWLVMFRQRRFCDEMARPVSYPDSQRFRWVTILHVLLPALLVTAAIYVLAYPRPIVDSLYAEAVRAVWPIVVLLLCFPLFLAAATGVPSYFFHPRDIPVQLQNRAIAMSYYACGPLAITALSAIAWAMAVAVSIDTHLGMGLLLFAILFPAGQLGAWWLDLIHITRRIMPQCKGRVVLVALSVPALWLLTLGLFLAAPLLILFLLLVLAGFG